jgi:uncharacterized membrane protein
MLDKLIIAFVVISIGFVVTVELMIRKGKLKRVDTYSYKAVVKRTIISFYLVVIISLLVYLFSKSLEVTVSLGILLLFGAIGGCLYGFLWAYQTKRRGGRRLD